MSTKETDMAGRIILEVTYTDYTDRFEYADVEEAKVDAAYFMNSPFAVRAAIEINGVDSEYIYPEF